MPDSAHNSCPCCAGQLIQQIRHQSVQWYCLSCRQEMPNLDPEIADAEQAETKPSDFSIPLPTEAPLESLN